MNENTFSDHLRNLVSLRNLDNFPVNAVIDLKKKNMDSQMAGKMPTIWSVAFLQQSFIYMAAQSQSRLQLPKHST